MKRPMKIETREDALLHCFDLWLWLAVTGSRIKLDWPGWSYLERCRHECPSCHYSYGWGSRNCARCPIPWKSVECDVGVSEYHRWRRAKTKTGRKKWALEIARLALDAM